MRIAKLRQWTGRNGWKDEAVKKEQMEDETIKYKGRWEDNPVKTRTNVRKWVEIIGRMCYSESAKKE